MTRNHNTVSTLDLVVPSGQLLQAEITKQWHVYVDGVYEEQYAPEEAVCLHGLFGAVNTLQHKSDLFKTIDQSYKDAVLEGAIEVGDLAIEALQRVRTKRSSRFRDNLFLLGHGTHSRFLLLSNVADEGFGMRVIEDYILAHPAEAGLRDGWESSFLQKLTAAQVIDRTKTQTYRASQPPASPQVVIIEPQVETATRDNSQQPAPRRTKRIVPRYTDFEPPILPLKEALPRLRQGIESLQPGSQFSLKDIFGGVDITSITQNKIDEGISLLLQHGYIVPSEAQGTYIRTARKFMPKKK